MYSTGFASSIFMNDKTPVQVSDFIKNLSDGEVLKFLEGLNSGFDTYFFKYSDYPGVKGEFLAAVARETEYFKRNNERVNLKFLKKALEKFGEKQSELRRENMLNPKNGITEKQTIGPKIMNYLAKRINAAQNSFNAKSSLSPSTLKLN